MKYAHGMVIKKYSERRDFCMGKNVLIISSSLRKNSNSEILAREAERGAVSAGHNVEFISLKDKEIKFCTGCLACQILGHCTINDDANDITAKIVNADVIVWATPIYYYEMSGQMKTLIDRANSLFASNYKFKEVYLLSTSADTSDDSAQIVINGLNGWISCFNGVKFCGYVNAGGVTNPLDIKKYPQYLNAAYELGKNM